MKPLYTKCLCAGMLLSATLATPLLISCTDNFLDTTSKTDLNSTSFYKTPEQADYALIGCYDQYQRTVSDGYAPTLYQAAETMSDDCYGGGGPDDKDNRILDRMDQSINTAQGDLFSGIWGDYYKAVYNCNLLINSLDGIAWSSAANRTAIEGQVRSLRALAYFDLVRMFENVPLLTQGTRDKVPQADPDSVYTLIVRDLRFAADNMPADLYKDKSNSLGRITKFSAAAMLARVYLFYDGVYHGNRGEAMPGGLTKADALQYCEDVIRSGNYALEPRFADLWPAACTEATSLEEGRKSTYKEASDEIVWVVKFNNDQNWSNGNANGNRFVVNFGMRNLNKYAPYGMGWGACPVTDAAHGIFSADDSRLQGTIIDCRTLSDGNGNTAYAEQANSDCVDYTGYLNKKYCPMIFTDGTSIPASETDVTGGNFMTSQDQNWILLRYSDVLLMAAELGSANAVDYMNQVRERAYGNASHNLTATPSREEIWQERRKEFMCEGIRYFDLRRQGLDAFVKAEVEQANVDGRPAEVYYNKEKTTIASSFVESNIRSKRGFFQIPKAEINLSGGVYKQNAGW